MIVYKIVLVNGAEMPMKMIVEYVMMMRQTIMLTKIVMVIVSVMQL